MDDAKVKIRQELDRMFVDAPQTRAAWELQEELLANCMERYHDLVKQGIQPDEAVRQVSGSIGNTDELIASLPNEDGIVGGILDAQRLRSSAVTTTVAIGLYIFAGVVFFAGVLISAYLWEAAILLGLIVAGLICIVPTCMLVYSAYRYPRYKKSADTLVENFKEWNSGTDKAKTLRKAVSSLIWTLTLVLYLLISFITFQWWITWIIFPIAACVETLISLLFRLKEL